MARWFRRKHVDSDDEQSWTDERIAANRAERERRLVGKEGLVAQIESLLFTSDPMGINFEHNTDEYEPEAQTIALRLPEAATAAELHRIVYEEFVRWFGEAGSEEQYAPIAADIWALTHPVDGA